MLGRSLGGAQRIGSQRVLEAGDAPGLGELARADSEDPAEAAQEGEAANPGCPGQVGESRALVGVLRKILRGGGNDSGLGVGAWSCAVRLAALAGAIAGLFRRGRGGEEGDVLPRRATARTAWAAVYSGRPDGIKELAVGVLVASEHLLPLASGKETGYGAGWQRGRWLIGLNCAGVFRRS
jgi:hypothetical protein